MAVAREGQSNPYALDYGFLFQNYRQKDHFDWFWDLDQMKEKREMIISKTKSDLPQWHTRS